MLDVSYIEFVEQQIGLESRGPEWTEILTKRLKVLEPYVGIKTVLIHASGHFVTIKIEPEDLSVISIEEN